MLHLTQDLRVEELLNIVGWPPIKGSIVNFFKHTPHVDLKVPHPFDYFFWIFAIWVVGFVTHSDVKLHMPGEHGPSISAKVYIVFLTDVGTHNSVSFPGVVNVLDHFLINLFLFLSLVLVLPFNSHEITQLTLLDWILNSCEVSLVVVINFLGIVHFYITLHVFIKENLIFLICQLLVKQGKYV